MKKLKTIAGVAVLGGLFGLASCGATVETSKTSDVTTEAPTTSETPTTTNEVPTTSEAQTTTEISTTVRPTIQGISESLTEAGITQLLNDKGYAGLNEKLPDFSSYEGTDAYRKVSTLEELLDAIAAAKAHYTYNVSSVDGDAFVVRNNVVKNEGNWNNAIAAGLYVKTDTGYTQVEAGTTYPGNTDTTVYYEKSGILPVTYQQSPADGYTEDNYKGTVRVIEITEDIDLGWKSCPAKYYPAGGDYATNSLIENFSRANKSSDETYTKSSMYETYGISKIKIENTSDLMIYSKTGAKLTHGGFSVQSSDNIVFRNIEMDEMWQWEDSSSASAAKVGDYDAYGWAYMKIGFCGNVWIDHCTFGKSFDGQIDVSNPTYTSKATVFRAPLGADGSNAVHISWCNFTGGLDNEDGYLAKMMAEIEADYQAGGTNYLYYNALRNAGYNVKQIMYGIAIPQKKAFLDGDSGDEYCYNTNLRVSIANCKFTNIEDRLPKVRSGVAYMYNTVIDNSKYYVYRTLLKDKGIASTVSAVNGSWKCALVSQGIVCGNGGSVAAKNCKFNGIEYLLKDNDSTLTNNANDPEATVNGGYKLVNCSYKRGKSDAETTTDFTNATPDKLTEALFRWRTADGNAPFEVAEYSIADIEAMLTAENYGIGVQADFVFDWTKTR